MKAFQNIVRNWDFENFQAEYGRIVFMDTGSGKTYIAIMLIKHLFQQAEDFNLRSQTPEEIEMKLI